MYICMYVCIQLYICIHLYMFMCAMYIYLPIGMHVCMYVCMCAYVYACMHVACKHVVAASLHKKPLTMSAARPVVLVKLIIGAA